MLVGANNSGKTSILEALLLMASPLDPRRWADLPLLRGAWPMTDTKFGGGSGDTTTAEATRWLFPLMANSAQPNGAPLLGEIALRSHQTIVRLSPSSGHAPDNPWVQATADIGPKRSQAFTKGFLLEHQWEIFGHPPPGSLRYNVAVATTISHRSDAYLQNRFSRLVHSQRVDDAVALLQKLDPKVRGLTIAAPADDELHAAMPIRGAAPRLLVSYGDLGFVPVATLGDGLRRALHFAILIAELAGGGLLLVDEIEVGLHPTALREVFRWLAGACAAADVQLFATTHSLEAVDAMLDGMPDEDLIVYRIQATEARRFAGDQLRRMRDELGYDVR